MRAFLVFTLVLVVACSPCRRIETTPVEIDCTANSDFVGELHFDTAGSYRSFLSDRCLTDAAPAEIDALVAAVDFTQQAVFVARGVRQGISRCIQTREAENVDVCDDGLRVVFLDEESRDETCGGLWTVALVLPREELRAAIEDDDSGDFLGLAAAAP